MKKLELLTIESFGFKAILTLKEFEKLNNEEVVSGYLTGIKGVVAEPNKTRSYYHGYLNGLNDGGFRKHDKDQLSLIRLLREKTDYLETHKALLDNFVAEVFNNEKITYN